MAIVIRTNRSLMFAGNVDKMSTFGTSIAKPVLLESSVSSTSLLNKYFLVQLCSEKHRSHHQDPSPLRRSVF